MKHPVQSLASCQTRNLLLCGCHDTLHVFRFDDKTHLATWSSQAKARIIDIAVSKSEEYIAITTAEDKALHVFRTAPFEHLKEKQMPKRPSAIEFTQDDEYILLGDKFGDVYAVSVDESQLSVVTNPDKNDLASQPQAQRYKPAATELTVHSERNRKALQNQLKNAANPQPRQKVLDIEPIIGHVSMLTDIVAARQPSPGTSKYRQYILTSDRDEHIRVSRGVHQSHVIENFCWGHTQFVSRMCLVTDDILVAGGGDDYLTIWRWVDGALLCKLGLGGASMRNGERPIAVSGLWSMTQGSDAIAFICSLEGEKGVRYIRNTGSLTEPRDYIVKHLPLEGNLLDLAVFERKICFAVDNLHLQGSAVRAPDSGNTSTAMNDTNGRMRLQVAQRNEDCLLSDVEAKEWNDAVDLATGDFALSSDSRKQLEELLYGVEKLRKRGGGADED